MSRYQKIINEYPVKTPLRLIFIMILNDPTTNHISMKSRLNLERTSNLFTVGAVFAAHSC